MDLSWVQKTLTYTEPTQILVRNCVTFDLESAGLIDQPRKLVQLFKSGCEEIHRGSR